ncbi:hypothetical protein ACF059_01925 [Streptomyces sp. NPDC016562]|uniref:hypothetical protein n=1 Tax=Streptomyces sp. NPDC016562 TaxID=3364966 RepID=UPI0036FF1478
MSTLATRIAKTAAAAVIAVGVLGAAHASTGEPSQSPHVSAFDFGSVTVPLDPTPQGDKEDITDVTWGH